MMLLIVILLFHIILDETKRMTNLVEDLLYLSRLDAIEENYTL